VRAEAKGLEQDRGSPTQDGVAADHLLDAVTLCPAACRALRHFDTCSQALPAERSLDRVREAAAGLARFQQRAAQGGVVARHDRERLGLGEKVLLMPPVGCAPGGADQFVEHLHGQVSQRRLALDGKRHQRREPALRSKAQQLARRQDARLTGQDGVAIGVNRAPPLVAEADPAQHSQPRRDPGEVLQRWSFPGLADPAVLGAAIVSPLGQQCFQGGALCAIKAAGQVAVGLPSRHRPTGKCEALDQGRWRHGNAALLEVRHDRTRNRLAPVRAGCAGRGCPD